MYSGSSYSVVECFPSSVKRKMHCCILINRVIANDFRHGKCTASPTLADQVDGRCGLYQKQTDAACYTCHIVFFSFPDRNQLKKHYHSVIQPFRLQPAVTLHKLTPQISSPVLSFERKISPVGFFFKPVLILFAQLEAFGIHSRIHFSCVPRN